MTDEFIQLTQDQCLELFPESYQKLIKGAASTHFKNRSDFESQTFTSPHQFLFSSINFMQTKEGFNFWFWIYDVLIKSEPPYTKENISHILMKHKDHLETLLPEDYYSTDAFKSW